MRAAWILALVGVAALPACRAPEPQGEREQAARAPADSRVGYDIRRLRPRNETTLADAYARARGRALEQGKRVAVLFSADWCEPCRILDAELGNLHPAEEIGDVRILEFKEEDWQQATRMDEFNELRAGFTRERSGTYPVFVLLDAEGNPREEMKAAKARLEAAGVEPTLANWFADTRARGS